MINFCGDIFLKRAATKDLAQSSSENLFIRLAYAHEYIRMGETLKNFPDTSSLERT